jgi:hypothetical protein
MPAVACMYVVHTRAQNREESDAFCKERFVRSDVPPEVTSEASALFDNTQLSLEDLEVRVAGR